MTARKPSSMAILASGSGTNFEAIVTASRDGRLPAHVAGLIGNKAAAPVMARAQKLVVPTSCFQLDQYASREAWNQAILDQLVEWSVDWVILAGFTGLIGKNIIERYPQRIVNSHPSLLPKFGGQGMYGRHVHQAVLDAGEVESGISIHVVTEKFDEGPVMAQKRLAILPGDTPESLAERLKAEERVFYPKVLADLLTGRIKTR